MAQQGTPTYKVTGLHIDFVSGTRNTLYASWDRFTKSHFDHYEIKWRYSTGQNIWFDGSSSNIDSASTTNSQYTIPANAIEVEFRIRPVAKDKPKKNKKNQGKYFTGAVVWDRIDANGEARITVPPTPVPSAEKVGSSWNITFSISGYDNNSGANNSIATDINFDVVIDDEATYLGASAPLFTDWGSASVTLLNVEPGHKFKARCRALGEAAYNYGADIYSDFSDFSSNVTSGAGIVIGKPTGTCLTESSIELSWNEALSAYNYEIWYVPDDPSYFETSPDQIVKLTIEEENHSTTRIITGLENTEGKVYFFKVRARGEESGTEGAWSEISDGITVGTVPEAPTTWSYATTCKIQENETMRLNWVHNSADSSKQTEAEIGIVMNGYLSYSIYVSGDQSSYEFDVSVLNDGDEIDWKVRTKGAVNSPDGGWGPWSGSKKFTAYMPPVVTFGLYENVIWYWDYMNFNTDTTYSTDGDGEDLINTVTKFPFVLKATAMPSTQTAISISVSIVSNSSYETLDEMGNTMQIVAGNEIYHEVFIPIDNTMHKVFRPFDIDLEDGMSYTITISAAMNSGLEAENTGIFDVIWSDTRYSPNMEYTLDTSNYACYIRPFVVNEEEAELTNVYLSVYRREYDGSFVTIAENLDGEIKSTVSDPHPSLNYARYRIVAMDKTTGAISYSDISGIEVGCTNIIIQWDEIWSNFNDSLGPLEDRTEKPAVSSMLQLPYNIDISADSKPDVALVEYIGRSSPVSYYGTQHGESGKWTCEIPKSDTETLYAIRRLAAYMGDVYVREPSGIGYWANVTVSYNMTHSKMTVPITFTVTRVEGGA